MPRPPSVPDTTSASTRTEPYPPWNPLLAYNNLPPLRTEQLTTPAIEERCKLATTALEALCDAADELADSLTLFQTTTLIEAHASSAIEGIVTTAGDMLERMDRPRRSNGTDANTVDALRHYDSILDAWQHRRSEPVGTAMAVRACRTTKGHRMPVRRGRGTEIAGPRGIVYRRPARIASARCSRSCGAS